MKVVGFKNSVLNIFDWTGIYCLIDFEKKTCVTNYGNDQLIDVELPED